MDAKLVSWARSVKSRRRHQAPQTPPLWLLTDARRLPDPLPAIGRLPVGLCGVVFRHDGADDRLALGRAVARLCRRRRLALVVAGDWRMARTLRAGLHLRGGRGPTGVTSSAHTAAQAHRAIRAGAAMVFISPVFATNSHPGAAQLGTLRWSLLARSLPRGRAAALGGIGGMTARRLPPSLCHGVGAIEALMG